MPRGALFAIIVCLAPVPAAAQAADPMQGPTFAEATGPVWGLATFESWLLLGTAAIAAQDGCGEGDSEELGCAGLFVLATVSAGVASGLAAAVKDAPAEAPFFWHHALWGGITGMMLGFGLSGGDHETRAALAVAGILVGGFAMGAYAWTQREFLLHDPRAANGVHVITWGVPVASLIGAVVGILIDDDEPDTMGLVASVAALLTYGVGIGIAEGNR